MSLQRVVAACFPGAEFEHILALHVATNHWLALLFLWNGQ